MGKGCTLTSIAAICIALFITCTTSADQITLQSGHTYDGDVISEDAQHVILDTSDSYHSMLRRIPKDVIKTWNRSTRQGQPYVVLPIQGVIGVDITADALKAGIAKAIKLHPRYIMLFIDSDGGNLAELEAMVNLLNAIPHEIQTIAFVHKAYSAAAVLAMACPQIYLEPDSVIGACVPMLHDDNGLPEDISAKFRSAIEAKQRVWVTAAGHDDLLLRGMIEMDLEIFLARDEAGNAALNTTGLGKPIKTRDKILTLTASDAAECGLGKISPDVADAAKQLTAGPAYEVSQRPWDAVIQVARKHKHLLLRQTALVKILPELKQLKDRFEILSAKSSSDKDAVAYLLSNANNEVTQLDSDYKDEITIARHQSDPNAAIAHATEARNTQYQQILQNFQNNSAPLKADQERADTEIAEIRDRVKELMATVPTFSD
jgi:ATP-dependent protease ClpP protease subunit